jgi:hypothetical protein
MSNKIIFKLTIYFYFQDPGLGMADIVVGGSALQCSSVIFSEKKKQGTSS